MIDAIANATRTRTGVLIGKAYATISLLECTKMLGNLGVFFLFFLFLSFCIHLSLKYTHTTHTQGLKSGAEATEYLTSAPRSWTIDGDTVRPTPVQSGEPALSTRHLVDMTTFIMDLENQ